MSDDRVDELLRKGERIRLGAYPEFTWPAVLVGWFLGAIIAVSISYAALKLGFSIEGSELAKSRVNGRTHLCYISVESDHRKPTYDQTFSALGLWTIL